MIDWSTAVAFVAGWALARAVDVYTKKMRLHALHHMQAPARVDPDQLTLL